MKRLLCAGAVLAALAFLLILNSDALGIGLTQLGLLGLAVGAVLASTAPRSHAAAAAGFAVGLLLTWAAYAVRAAVLPDAPVGQAAAAAGALVLITLTAAAFKSRGLLNAALLGLVAMAGAYETTFAQAPNQFLTTSPAAATGIALAAGLGFLATVAVAQPSPTGDPATGNDFDTNES